MRDHRRINLGDLSHLAPEDAELYAALYAERNMVSRGELARVQNNAGLRKHRRVA